MRIDVAKQNLLYENDDDQDRERERRRAVVRRKNFAHALDCQTGGGHEDAHATMTAAIGSALPWP